MKRPHERLRAVPRATAVTVSVHAQASPPRQRPAENVTAAPPTRGEAPRAPHYVYGETGKVLTKRDITGEATDERYAAADQFLPRRGRVVPRF